MSDPEYKVTNEKILQEIMLIHIKITELQLLEASRSEREKVVSNLAYAHERTINGNGKPGIKSEVQSLKEAMGRINWLGAIVTGAIVLDIVSRVLK